MIIKADLTDEAPSAPSTPLATRLPPERAISLARGCPGRLYVHDRRSGSRSGDRGGWAAPLAGRLLGGRAPRGGGRRAVAHGSHRVAGGQGGGEGPDDNRAPG